MTDKGILNVVAQAIGTEVDGDRLLPKGPLYHVRVNVWGGVTGSRTALLKDDTGAPRTFINEDDAEAALRRFYDSHAKNGHRYSVCGTVVPA